MTVIINKSARTFNCINCEEDKPKGTLRAKIYYGNGTYRSLCVDCAIELGKDCKYRKELERLP